MTVAGVFCAAFAGSSLVEWASHTVLEPDHVKPMLREANVYALLRTETLPDWLDAELVEFGVDDPEHRAFVARVLTEVVGEDELRERVDRALDQILPYLARESDPMTVQPRLAEWALEVPDTLARLDLPSFMVDSVLAPKLRPALSALAAEPLHARVDPDDARAIAREIAPTAWMDAQVVGATYAVARWAVGAQRTFEIRIDYAERVDAATEVFKRLLRRSDVEQVLVDRVVLPMAEQGLVGLPPFAEGVDREVLADVVREVAPRGWLTRQVDGLIDALGEWLAGRTDEIEHIVDTGALAGTAGDIVVTLARRTLGDTVAAAMEPSLRASVRQYFPDTTSWSTEDLRAGAGEEAYQQLLRMRGFVTDGFVYDQDDLRRDLSTQLGLGDAEIDRVRHLSSESYAYTEVDLQRDALGTDVEATLRRTRDAMAWALPIHLATLALLIALVFAAGPGTWRRALFTTGTLGVAGLAVWAALAPAVGTTLEAQALRLLPATDTPAEHPAYGALAAMAHDTAASLAAWGRNVLVLAALAFVTLFVLAIRARARARS